jgi:hypothetical protein
VSLGALAQVRRKRLDEVRAGVPRRPIDQEAGDDPVGRVFDNQVDDLDALDFFGAPNDLPWVLRPGDDGHLVRSVRPSEDFSRQRSGDG